MGGFIARKPDICQSPTVQSLVLFSTAYPFSTSLEVNLPAVSAGIMELLGILNGHWAFTWVSQDRFSLPVVAIISIWIVLFSYMFYNLYLHPLSSFPGPWYAAISDIFFARTIVSGHAPKTIRALHERYGEVVRVAPGELSFSSASAWKDIYTQRKSGEIFTKDHKFYITDDTLRAPHVNSIINVEEHAKARKILSPAFSSRSLLDQEDVVIKYADMLMVAIAEESRKGPLDLDMYYNWVTFDVLGELAFGESFGSVEARKTDLWISTIMSMVSFIAWAAALYRVSPMLEKMIGLLVPPQMKKAAFSHVMSSKSKILKRVKRGEGEKKDFCSYVLDIKDEMGLNDWHLTSYASFLIMAGSETTTTVMSSLTYYLCRTPRVYEKLKHEITSRTATFPYLTAVIHEIMRIFPPVPFGLPRIVSKGGETVDGIFIPGGTTVSVHSWSSTHNAKNFKDPDSFVPERWLDPDNTDNFSASNPFLLGPRGCSGQNMAWMEMRILIAKMVFLFDYELVDEKLDWVRDSPNMIIRQKVELLTKVYPRDVK
ncbi:cytochrome P450 [Mollisia scopiformis]|uniref:Cytochrome P450 n=1 Tax=Mollisia scopiformis TaxID=149040 RepID=A0A132B4Z2_MOLSC|nr:cytochrome P450 [Mollisia scopiformis]KUJ07472.1 cytochrome P450 [Mollisia scopiformis]